MRAFLHLKDQSHMEVNVSEPPPKYLVIPYDPGARVFDPEHSVPTYQGLMGETPIFPRRKFEYMATISGEALYAEVS